MSTYSFLIALMQIFFLCNRFYEIAGERSFVIDYDNNQFLKDGFPFQYISGSMHYFRVPKIYWENRFAMMLAAGLNTVQTYVEWSQHEPYPGQYNFEDNLDLVGFIQLAQKMGLLVILRAGPYIDAERDMGGFPFWLLQKNPNMALRTYDKSYLLYMDKWFDKLLPMIKPLLYTNGGPIISVQVENEYGSYYACDFNYMVHLRDLFRSYLGNDILLFTTDGNSDSFLKCGKTQGLYATVDFGPGVDVNASFIAQRNHEPKGPFVNSEYYPGWLDHWAYPHEAPDPHAVIKTLGEILSMNASVNIFVRLCASILEPLKTAYSVFPAIHCMDAIKHGCVIIPAAIDDTVFFDRYMFHGGTNFGFTNGGNYDSTYMAIPTSYDYNAPLSEAGDPTPKYEAIRNLISQYTGKTPPPVPSSVPKYKYGTIQLTPIASLFDVKYLLSSQLPIASKYPMTFEELGQAYGFVLYETIIKGMYMDPTVLKLSGLKDRAYVFIDEVISGILSRQDSVFSLPLTVWNGQKLSILVENQGRVCYGSGINDFKGLTSNVTLDDTVLTDWMITPLPLNNTIGLRNIVKKLLQRDLFRKKMQKTANGQYTGVGLFAGSFVVPSGEDFPMDTFINMQGWYKGLIFINNFNLGRYWPIVGPQITLYVPKSVLNPYPQKNYIVMMELEKSPCFDNTTALKTESLSNVDCSIALIDTPIINAPTPHDDKGSYSQKIIFRHG